MNLHDYDIVVINSSAGKDSLATLDHVVALAAAQAYPRERITVAHADLGRVEWQGTKDLAERQAAFYGVAFIAIARPQGDLLEHVRQRRMWPSSTTRYCTSDHKRGQVAKVIVALEQALRRTVVRTGRPVAVLNIFGFRAEESPARAKRPRFALNKRLTTRTRTVYDWLPIQDWTVKQVWGAILASGAPWHRAYELGMPRLSCVFCIFSPKAALVLAGKHNRALLDQYVQVEQEIGHRFRVDLSMAEVKAAVDADEPVGTITDWRM